MADMHRVRFWARDGDPRPVEWPPPGPFWCTGYRERDGRDEACVVAFVPNADDVPRLWPDATDIDDEGVQPVRFTDRFQRPDWWENDDG